MSLIKNSLYSVGAFAIPALIAIPSYAVLARSLPNESFGIFTLLFAIIGFSGFLDLGLTRAITRFVSIYKGNDNKLKYYVVSSISMLLIISVLVVFVLTLLSPKIVEILSVSEMLRDESIAALTIASFSIPFFLITLVYLSYLEGIGDFKSYSYLRIISGVHLFLIPVFFVTVFSSTITSAILGVLFSRLIAFTTVFLFLRNRIGFNLPTYTKPFAIKELMKFSGWITISNIITPLLVYMDRFFLSNLSGAANVAFYTAPNELISKSLSVPSAIGRVVFARASSRNCTADTFQAYKLIFIFVCLMVVPFFLFADSIILIWLGNGYEESSSVLRLMLLGLIAAAFAQVPFSLIQAWGFASITAKIHMIELLPYMLLLYFLVDQFSYKGAAIAWVIRIWLDAIILFITMKKLSTGRDDIL